MGRLERRLNPQQPSTTPVPEPVEQHTPDFIPEQEIIPETIPYQEERLPYVQQAPQQQPTAEDYYRQGYEQGFTEYPQMQTTYEDEQFNAQNPLAILDEIKQQPSPKGTIPIMIGGRPVDLHAVEDYVVKVSPYHLRTILRYHNARTIEEIKNYSQRLGGKKMNIGTIFLILLAVGMAVMGIVVMMFLPDIMAIFSGGMGMT